MWKKPALIGAAILLAISPAALATAQDLPTIYLYVNDFAGVLTLDEFYSLDDLCYELDTYTSDEIAVTIVDTTEPIGIDLYAVELFEENGIGKKDKDNGVLVLVSTDEQLWRIEVGYGVEGILNDAKVGAIGRDNLEPYMAEGDYYSGLYLTVYALATELLSDPDRLIDEGNSVTLFGIDTWQLAIAIIVLVAVTIVTKGRVFLWLGNVLTRGKFGGGRSGGGGARGGI